MRRLAIGAVGAVLLVAVLGVALVEWHPELLGRRSGGPLACPHSDCGRSGTGVPLHVGGSASVGPLALENEWDETVVLERVELLDVDPGLVLIDILVIEPDGRHYLVGSRRGFPPAQPGGTTHAVRGYELPPAKSNADFVQVLFGLRLTKPIRAGARRIAVDYSAGGVPYRAIFDHSMWLCTWRVDREEGCIDPDW